MHRKLTAIVPAAGIGARASGDDTGTPAKQYRLLKGEPMLRWAVKALLADPRVTEVRVAVAAHDLDAGRALAGLPRTVWRGCGGPDRAATVIAALQDAMDAGLQPQDWVLVHDAARPGLPAASLSRLIDVCLSLDRGGLLAQPVADTVKLARSGSDEVAKTLSRDGLWLAQTPQLFQAGALRDALRAAHAAGVPVTDEASAMEHAGYIPSLIPGSVRNFKVTWPEDFALMEKWLEN
jgi:2-C-methyl-D-erythritol 4-phosphate cytidylyltransferase